MLRRDSGLIQFIRRQWNWVVAVCVGSALAHAPSSLMPFQVGALIDGSGRSAEQAGRFGFVELCALALGMIVISPKIDRFSPGRIAMVSALLAVLANLGLFVVHDYAAQILCGALAGAAFGFVFAATIAGAASCGEADRLYAIGNGGALLLIMGVMATLPRMTVALGPGGIFLGIAILALACAPAFAGLRGTPPPPGPRLAAWRVPGAAGLLLSWAGFSIGSGGVYAFSERIAHSAGLLPGTIGLVLSGGVFVGVAGTGTAALVGNRIHRRWALTLGMLVTALACAMLGYATALPQFVIGVALYWIATMFLYSYLLGSAAQLDPAGRVGTLGGGVERLGYGVGAWCAGGLADHFGYGAVGAMGVAACLGGLTLGFPSLFRALDRANGASRPAAGSTLEAP